MKLSCSRILASLLALSAIAAPILVAQGASSSGTAAPDARVEKGVLAQRHFNQLDVLSKILPINLTKPQMNALLSALEQARSRQTDTLRLDGDELAKLDPDVTKSVEDGINKSIVPSREIQNRIIKVTGALAIRRQIAFGEMTQVVYDACQKNLDAGQRKVMGNTLKPEAMDPTKKGAEMNEEQKEKFFIQTYLLNDTAYDLLLRMSKAGS